MDKSVSKTNRQIYEKLYGRSLAEQELFNIKRNLTGFFTILMKMDKQQRKNSNEQSN